MPRGNIPTPLSTLVIACGALAREITDLKRANNWQHMTVQCLPAEFHNYPDKIPEAVRAKIREMRADYDQVFVAYADCGTGGLLDRVLEFYPGNCEIRLVGGAPLNEAFAEAVGADAYCRDAAVAVETAKEMMARRHNVRGAANG